MTYEKILDKKGVSLPGLSSSGRAFVAYYYQ